MADFGFAVWDRKAGCLFQEFMEHHPATYESQAEPFLRAMTGI